MNGLTGPSSGAFQRAMDYLRQRQQAAEEKKHERHFTIAVSRQRGARGSRVAAEVGRQLGWHVYDRDLLDEIATTDQMREALAEHVDEKHQGWISQCLDSLRQDRPLSEPAYVHRLVKVFSSFAAHGNCVVVGRGAGFILPVDTTLRVGLVAPFKQRVQQIAQEQELTESDAERVLKQADHDRERFVKDHFHKDAGDADNYDLILNTHRFSDAACAAVIVEALKQASH